MKKINYFYTALFVLAVGISSCNRDNLEPAEIQGNSILGQKLENPYTIEVMQQAWKNIQSDLLAGGRISSSNDLKLTPTHYYIKFKPENEDELDILNADSTLELYGHPLDYEVFEGINNYRDPEVAEGQPTYQYAAIPIGHELPNVMYEKLADVFIPEDAPMFASARMDQCIPIMLTNEAMTITNNLEYLIPIEDGCGGGGGGGGGGSTGCSYCPQGTMRVWDDTQNKFVPIVGLKVKARVFLNTKTAITNATGKYIIRHNFSNKKQYSLEWKRYDFTVRWYGFDAGINGPKTKGWWSLNIRGGLSQFHATIFRAAHHYYYGNIKGLRRPPQNSFWKTQVKLKAVYAVNADAAGNHAPSRRFYLGSQIKIFNPQFPTKNIYATTIHELAHASHWGMGRNSDYNQSEDVVAESWARGVQWELTRMVYPNYLGGQTNRPNYTQVVVDMIDRPSLINHNNGSEILSEDNVEGYTIRQIEDALIGERKWNEWRDNIKSKYTNGTQNNLDALFSYWN